MTQVASRPKKVLLIDRDARLGHVRCLVLQSQGYEATCVTDASTVLKSWTSKTYDLVLVDVQHNPDAALAFCSDLKKKDVAQLVALISDHHVWVPPHPCPDEVIPRSEGPAGFVEKVRNLLETQIAESSG
jgi:hypothetical protein